MEICRRYKFISLRSRHLCGLGRQISRSYSLNPQSSAVVDEDVYKLSEYGRLSSTRRKVMGYMDDLFKGVPAEHASTPRATKSEYKPLYSQFHKDIHAMNWLVDPPWLRKEPYLKDSAEQFIINDEVRTETSTNLKEQLKRDYDILYAAVALRRHRTGVSYLSDMVRRRQMNLACAKQGALLLWTAHANASKPGEWDYVSFAVRKCSRWLLNLVMIPKDVPDMDQYVLEILLKSILPNQWKSALAMFQRRPEVRSACKQCAPALICAAFKYADQELALRLLKEYYPENVPTDVESRCHLAYAYMSWMKYLMVKQMTSRKAAIDIVESLRCRTMTMNKGMMQTMNIFIDRCLPRDDPSDVTTTFDAIYLNGAARSMDGVQCKKCAERLQRTVMPEEHRLIILDAVTRLNETASRRNISNAEDMQILKETYLAKKKYKVVIDGLSTFAYAIVQYHPDERCYHPDKMRLAIEAVCETFNCSSEDVLVVYKGATEDNFANFYLDPLWKDLEELVDVFAVQNHTNDDLVITYAAMSCGPNCVLVSRDRFTEIFDALPNDDVKTSYYQYILTKLSFIKTSANFKPLFQVPYGCDVGIHKTEKGYHIPISDGHYNKFYCNPMIWYCMQIQHGNKDKSE